ncbi:MAG: ribbon-helix-helix domain-containing protein [Acidobacteriota bacterium]|nr:ribbon-helix-helix domain-containing protein [Blastocatellia bacterium]MDW8241258.1 ribbon-helix-helix domain-containing protein [Acidobacteriota bacterium]
MESDITIEEKSSDDTPQQSLDVTKPAESSRPSADALEELAASVKEFAAKIPDSISKVVERALSGRDVPLMVRVNDETLRRIDQLVESGVFQNRSESVAFLISEGIKAQSALFEQIESKVQEIEKLREELKNIIRQQRGEQ